MKSVVLVHQYNQ